MPMALLLISFSTLASSVVLTSDTYALRINNRIVRFACQNTDYL